MPDPRQKILLVEDEAFNIRVLLDLLKPRYQIAVAKDGVRALERLRTDPLPDLILLDVMIPGIDGHEVCAKLKREDSTKDIPIIFMTAKREPEDIIKGFELGAVDYVIKPINYMELLNRVKTHLRLRETAQNLLSALDEIHTLRGFLPICSYCKKIRNDKGFWEVVEEFIGKRTEVQFQYGLCPECSPEDARLFPDSLRGGIEQSTRTGDGLTKEVILIAEDERFNVNLLTDTLKPKYDLVIAKDGRRALELAGSPKKPSLILLDVLMPEMDGFEVCRKLQLDDATKEIPVVFMTVRRETDDILRGFDYGAVDYLIKPINYMELLARVETHLSLKRKLSHLQKALREISALSSLLPICPKCKRVRDDQGYWNQIEAYFRKHSDAEFTHGICPECAKKHFPNLELAQKLHPKNADRN